MASLPGTDVEEDHGKFTDDNKQWIGIPVADCVKRAKRMWRFLVSVSVTSDSQT